MEPSSADQVMGTSYAAWLYIELARSDASACFWYQLQCVDSHLLDCAVGDSAIALDTALAPFAHLPGCA